MYIFFEIKIQGVASPYIVSIFLATVPSTFKKKRSIVRRLYSDNESDRKVKWTATNSMMSYIKCSLPYFDPCSLFKIRFYLNVMLDKLISYIVCLYKIIYQVEPVVWTSITRTGLDINVCPVPVKTDVGQVKKSDSQTCRYDRQIYFHWYKILGLLYKRAPFNLQFVHNLFWLKLKWNA